MSSTKQFLTALTIAISNCSLYAKEHELIEEAAKKAFSILQELIEDQLEMMVIDTDCGIGVIREGGQNKIKIKGRLNWKNLDAKRSEWLNLVSVEEFKKKFKLFPKRYKNS